MLPKQDNPFPVNPALQLQLKEPTVFWQTAKVLHGEFMHSLISVEKKVMKSP